MTAGQGAEPRVDSVVDADGGTTFELPPGPDEEQRLLLCLRPKKGQPEKVRHVLDLLPADEGRRRAVLSPDLFLAEGRWDVYLLRAPDSGRQRLRPGLRDLRALVEGHLRDRPSPLAVRIPYVTKDGYLTIRTWLRAAHAEVEAVDVTDRAATVTARLHGAGLLPGAAVRLRLRGHRETVHTVSLRAGDDGRAFSFALDYEELATRAGVWDAFVQPSPDAPPIRIARLLDDVANRKEVFVYPPATVGDAVLRPYYTVDNDLSVEVAQDG